MQTSIERISSPWPQNSALLLFAIATTGCGPMWYGPPPPTMPPGQGFPPGQMQRPTMVPGNSTPLQVPSGQNPGGAPPSTFQNGSPGSSLNDVPNVDAEQVLTVPTPKSATTYYDVRQGDTLSSIARKFGVTVEALKTANVFDENSVLQPDQVILIP